MFSQVPTVGLRKGLYKETIVLYGFHTVLTSFQALLPLAVTLSSSLTSPLSVGWLQVQCALIPLFISQAQIELYPDFIFLTWDLDVTYPLTLMSVFSYFISTFTAWYRTYHLFRLLPSISSDKHIQELIETFLKMLLCKSWRSGFTYYKTFCSQKSLGQTTPKEFSLFLPLSGLSYLSPFFLARYPIPSPLTPDQLPPYTHCSAKEKVL